MRHRKKGVKLGRDQGSRKALYRNLVTALVEHERIRTTEAKAKAVRGMVDRAVTRSKEGSLHARRQLISLLDNKKAVGKLIDEIGPRFKNRQSGYTRIVRLGRRQGDNALMVRLEFVEPLEENMSQKKRVKKSQASEKKKSESAEKSKKSKKTDSEKKKPQTKAKKKDSEDAEKGDDS